jgi:stage II sporulation protein D
MSIALCLVSSALCAEETVRIAIVDGVQQIGLAGKGLEVRKLEVGERYSAAPGGRSVVFLSKGEMKLDGAKVDAVDGVKFRSEGFVRVADQPVRGQIEVRRNGRGLIAINVIPLEDYLAAVLGSEMPSSFPAEALKAQAVAARTYAVRRKIEAWGKPFHLGATVLHQVYGGAKAEDPHSRQAVKETRGEVLTYQMDPIEAFFHSSCGGRTESGFEALGRDRPYLQPVDCACATEARTRWNEAFGPGDFKPLVNEVRDMKVLERTPTGRVKRVALATPRGKKVATGADLRRALGYMKLRSLSFEVKAAKGKITVSGQGFGHGAGMCQWGAKAYAEKGWDYKRILEHYYSGAELRRMY